MDKLVLYNVAKLYYMDGKNQQEIANIMNYSRPQISRFLKEARNSHIVEITLNPPYGISWDARADQLRNLLGISKVTIVNTSDYTKSNLEARTGTVAEFSACYLPEQFSRCSRVGIGWGHTIYETIHAMSYAQDSSDITFIPLLGNAGLNDPAFQTNAIVNHAADCFKAKREFINTPTYVISETAKNELLTINNLNLPNSLWDGLDVALFSMGGFPEIQSAAEPMIGKNLLQRVIASKAVGDIFGRYFDKNGHFVMEENGIWDIGISEQKLKNIPHRICVALGSEKVDCILTAARSDFFTELITDHYTADELLKRVQQSEKA